MEFTIYPQNVPEMEHEEEEEEFERKIASRLETLQEELRQVRGTYSYGGTHFDDLCLYPNAKLPPKFKCPEFEKYSGTGCPMSHLKLYCGAMCQYGRNEK